MYHSVPEPILLVNPASVDTKCLVTYLLLKAIIPPNGSGELVWLSEYLGLVQMVVQPGD